MPMFSAEFIIMTFWYICVHVSWLLFHSDIFFLFTDVLILVQMLASTVSHAN